jgi:Fe-Mn family superoxide dismutase
MKLTEQSFQLPENYLGKLSTTTISEHLGLYRGYISNVNALADRILTLRSTPDQSTYELGELYRRYAFEYNGVRNHEHYFTQIEQGPSPINPNCSLYNAVQLTFGSWGSWVQSFTQLAKTRGIGWAVLWQDKISGQIIQSWIDEQHIGLLGECSFVYGIDMWEHSYVHDYLPSGKAAYIADYIANTNWAAVSNRFDTR